MLNNVRLSILEREDWKWKKRDDEESYDISSESSGFLQNSNSSIATKCVGRKFVNEIWKRNNIEISLRKFSNSNEIIKLINTKDFTNIMDCQDDLNAALLMASWLRLSTSVHILLEDCHANPNANDNEGRTALHLSCFNGDSVITKTLLKYGAPAHQWDSKRQITPLHCAASAGSTECVQLLIRYGAQLNAGIEKRSALHYAVENNHIHCVRVLLDNGAEPNTPQCYTETALHVSASFGYKECIRLLIEHGADVKSQYGERKMTALHFAVEEDSIDCVKILLDAEAAIDVINTDGQTPLHLACLGQCTEIVELLIERGANVHATYKDGRTALHAAIVRESKEWDCARLLLNAGIDVNKPDNYGYTPLHMAALNEFGTCAYLLIESGADLTARTNGRITALSFIIRRTPEVIPKYLEIFNESVKVNDNDIGDVDCEIRLDFKVLVPNKKRGETELLLAFIEIGQKQILKHPLCETFLYLKWRRIRKFFLFSLLCRAIYVLLFTYYILGVYVKDENSNNDSHILLTIVGSLTIVLNVMMLGKEIFQMAHGFMLYTKNWENWLQLTIILSIFLCVVDSLVTNLNVNQKWQNHVAAIVILFMWMELMMIVGRLPVFGLYVQMFTKVAVNFSKFLIAYCCLLMAFALSFCVLFANKKPFKSVMGSLLKTIIMMIGEFEYDDLFYPDDDNNDSNDTNNGNKKTKYDDKSEDDKIILYPFTSQIIFLAFVLLITVILANLLVGLAVSDIQGLQASASLDRLTRQAELVSRLENMFYSKILEKVPSRILRFCQKKALLRTSRRKLKFFVKPNDPREQRLPKEMIVSIYKLVAERNQSLHRKKKKMTYNMLKTISRKKELNIVQLRKASEKHLNYANVTNRPQKAVLKSSINDVTQTDLLEKR